MEAAAKRDIADARVHLQLAHGHVAVGGDDDVHVLNGAAETTVHLLHVHLHLKNAAVHLVDEEAWLHPLLQGLPENCLSLHCTALDAVHHHHGPVRDSQCRSDLRREVHMARGVDQVDEVRPGPLSIFSVVVEKQGHACALDRHAALLLILPRMREARLTSSLVGDDPSSRQHAVRQDGLPVVHVRDNAHGADVLSLVHDAADLLHRELRHAPRANPGPPEGGKAQRI
mmetsp:Transcript_41289/g.74029  ORF Transcript_41289/g.74029 Transcript_41289/m.74029 type:complete len:228 (+) Transcript_41289:2101-2784(+)